MKVGTCLNPLHTALAVFGCLLDYQTISAEMQDTDLVTLVERIAGESLPVVEDPGILRPTEFIHQVLHERFPTRHSRHAPRIATDTSQKLPVRYGGTLRRYRERSLPMVQLRYIPLVFAGWCRYLLGVDDAGKTMPVSPDPLLPQLQPLLADVTLGKPDTSPISCVPSCKTPISSVWTCMRQGWPKRWRTISVPCWQGRERCVISCAGS